MVPEMDAEECCVNDRYIQQYRLGKKHASVCPQYGTTFGVFRCLQYCTNIEVIYAFSCPAIKIDGL